LPEVNFLWRLGLPHRIIARFPFPSISTISSIIGTIAWLSGRTIAVALPVPFQENGIY
jgi:hypothetical protein